MANETLNIIVSATDNASGALRGIASALGTISQVAGGVVLGQLFGDIKDAINGAVEDGLEAVATFEQMQLSIQSLMAVQFRLADTTLSTQEAFEKAGSTAEKYMHWIEALAVQSRYTAVEVGNVFQLGKVYGFTGDQTQYLTQQIVDLGSAMGLSPAKMNTIMLDFGKIRQEGRLFSRDFNSLARAGFPVDLFLKQIAETMGITTQEAQDLRIKGAIPASVALKAFSDVMGNNFAGSAKRFQYSITGALTSLNDIRSLSLANFFKGVFNPIEPIVHKFIDLFAKEDTYAKIAGWGNVVGGYLKQGIDFVGAFLTQWGGLLSKIPLVFTKLIPDVVSRVYGFLKSIGTAFVNSQMFQNITSTLDKIRTTITTAFVTKIIPAFLNGANAFIQTLRAGGGIAAAIRAFVNSAFPPNMAAGINAFLDVLSTIGNKIKSIISNNIIPAITSLTQGDFKGAFENLIGADAADRIIAIGGKIASFISTYILPAIKALFNFVEAHPFAAAGIAGGLLLISGATGALANHARDIVYTVAALKDLGIVAKGIGGMVGGLLRFSGLTALFAPLVSFLGTTVSAMWAAVTAGAGLGGVFAVLSVMITPLLLALGQVVLVLGGLVVAGGLMYTAWTQNWGGIQQVVTGAIIGLIDALGSMWNAITSGAAAAGNGIMEVLGQYVNPALKGLFEAFAELGSALAPILGPLFGSIGKILGTAFMVAGAAIVFFIRLVLGALVPIINLGAVIVRVVTGIVQFISPALLGIGDAINAVVAPVASLVGWIINNLVPALAILGVWLAGAIPAGLQNLGGLINGLVSGALGQLGGILNGIAAGGLAMLGNALAWLGGVLNQIGGQLNSFAAMVQEKLAAPFAIASTIIINALKVIGIVIGVAILIPVITAIGVIYLLVSALHGLWDVGVKTFNEIADAIRPLLQQLGGAINEAIGGIADKFRELGGWLNQVGGTLNAFGGQINAAIGGALAQIGGLLNELGGWLNQVGGTLNAIGGQINAFVGKIAADIGGMLNDLGGQINAWASTVLGFFGQLGSMLMMTAGIIGGQINTLVSNAWDMLGTVINATVGAIAGMLSPITDLVQSAIGIMGEAFAQLGGWLNGIIPGFIAIGVAIKTTVIGALETLKTTVDNILKGISQAIASFLGSINGLARQAGMPLDDIIAKLNGVGVSTEKVTAATYGLATGTQAVNTTANETGNIFENIGGYVNKILGIHQDTGDSIARERDLVRGMNKDVRKTHDLATELGIDFGDITDKAAAAKAATDKLKDAVKNMVEQALKPTEVEEKDQRRYDIAQKISKLEESRDGKGSNKVAQINSEIDALKREQDALGPYITKWDEFRRRVEAIATGTSIDQFGANFKTQLTMVQGLFQNLNLDQIAAKFKDFSLFADAGKFEQMKASGIIDFGAIGADIDTQIQSIIGKARVMREAFNNVWSGMDAGSKMDLANALGLDPTAAATTAAGANQVFAAVTGAPIAAAQSGIQGVGDASKVFSDAIGNANTATAAMPKNLSALTSAMKLFGDGLVKDVNAPTLIFSEAIVATSGAFASLVKDVPATIGEIDKLPKSLVATQKDLDSFNIKLDDWSSANNEILGGIDKIMSKLKDLAALLATIDLGPFQRHSPSMFEQVMTNSTQLLNILLGTMHKVNFDWIKTDDLPVAAEQADAWKQSLIGSKNALDDLLKTIPFIDFKQLRFQDFGLAGMTKEKFVDMMWGLNSGLQNLAKDPVKNWQDVNKQLDQALGVFRLMEQSGIGVPPEVKQILAGTIDQFVKLGKVAPDVAAKMKEALIKDGKLTEAGGAAAAAAGADMKPVVAAIEKLSAELKGMIEQFAATFQAIVARVEGAIARLMPVGIADAWREVSNMILLASTRLAAMTLPSFLVHHSPSELELALWGASAGLGSLNTATNQFSLSKVAQLNEIATKIGEINGQVSSFQNNGISIAYNPVDSLANQSLPQNKRSKGEGDEVNHYHIENLVVKDATSTKGLMKDLKKNVDKRNRMGG